MRGDCGRQLRTRFTKHPVMASIRQSVQQYSCRSSLAKVQPALVRVQKVCASCCSRRHSALPAAAWYRSGSTPKACLIVNQYLQARVGSAGSAGHAAGCAAARCAVPELTLQGRSSRCVSCAAGSRDLPRVFFFGRKRDPELTVAKLQARDECICSMQACCRSMRSAA